MKDDAIMRYVAASRGVSAVVAFRRRRWLPWLRRRVVLRPGDVIRPDDRVAPVVARGDTELAVLRVRWCEEDGDGRSS